MFFAFIFFFLKLIFSDTQEINLGNEYLSITWNITESGTLLTKNLLNKRANPNVQIIPQVGSEEFTISILRDKESPYPSPISDKSKWSISSNSEKRTEGNDGPIKNLIDNDPKTIWHSWENEDDDTKGGHDDRENHQGDYNFTINFGEKLTFKAISFTQKPTDVEGVVRFFKLYVGDSLEDVTQKVKEGKVTLDSYFSANKNRICYLNLTEEVSCQYIIITTKGDGRYATGAQFDIYTDYIPYVNDIIKATDLKCIDHSQENEKVTFTFDTFKFNDANYNIIEVYELIKGKPYVEKHLEIKCDKEDVKIDYIDLDHYFLTTDDRLKSWSTPFVDELFVSLGQPYYMNTFYAGCRFPYTHTMIESSNLARNRYYSGKKVKDLTKNDQGAYVTWKTVIGAARDSRIEVVRNDFFSYISDISVASPFRKQYNSWYDWMLKITEENIMTSFKEIERGCSQYGLPPFDSYVVDDGWNNYNSDKYGVYDEGTSGTTYNKDGFWEFNNKFPNMFKNPSDFTRKISSNFGVWLGPRGGYVTPGQFGKMIEDAKNGFYNPQSDDIDVGSHTYLKNVQKLLVDFIKTYKVNYYKLDGFVEQPCFNETHDHMVGGPDGIYFFTDLWENVYIWYEDMIQTAKDTGIHNFWISTTTWASPSPFQLQWSNSIWIQISYDKGEILIGDNDNQADQMLTYRDDCYYQFYNEMELQFPARCLYNHDPIYGQAGTTLRGSLDDDFFRTFLYGCAMRGTAFFELYYTYDMLDEGDKWYINSDVLSWAERNFDALQHSQIFGGKPGIGEFYGFSAWNETNGIIGIRNPGAEVVKEKIVLDRNIGVPEEIGTVYRCTLLDHKTQNTNETVNKVPFKYADTLEVTLVPGEYRIYEFRPSNDQDAPTIEVVKTTKENEVMIRFNKRVNLKDATFSIDGLKINETRLRGDRRTVTLKTDPMKNYSKYQLIIKDVKDIFDNGISTAVSYQYFSNNMIGAQRGEFSGSDSVLVDTTVSTDSFTIRFNVKDFKGVKDCVILHSDDDSISVEITDDNHIKFTVGRVTVVSESVINEKTQFITLVRERNALVKIYIGTEIDASKWDKTMPSTVSLSKLILDENDIVYNYVKVFNYGFAYSEVSTEISLKNEFIERVFSISNSKVKTIELINYRTDSITAVTLEEGSEEFLFSIPTFSDNMASEKVDSVYRVKNLAAPKPIDRKDWKVTANSEQNVTPGTKEGPAPNIIDGNINTIWHSKYNNNEGGHDDRADSKDPFQVTFDLGKDTDFKAFSYTPRQEGVNGRINHYEIYVAHTMEDLNKSISNKSYKLKGDFFYSSLSPIYVNFSTPQKGRYVALLSIDHDTYGTGADFSLYADYVPLPYFDLRSSSLELDHYEKSDTENSQIITFIYKPYVFNKVEFNITVEYELQNNKHYIEKEITIKIPEDKYNEIKFDYLDLDHFVISNGDKEKSWTHPFVDSPRGDLLTKYIITLGQPVYVNSFFTGCRFPFSDNQIVDDLVYLRYQVGKNFSQLKTNEDGSYHCWKTVIGTARSSNIEVVRNDFYSYITDISVENKFRKQYNSWYDWMLTITESNILSSFKEIEKGCTQMGVKPLDSYVIDDGWNNYNYNSSKYYTYDEARSGTTFNEVGFWTINNKFQDGFNKPADFAHSVSSDFGVWLGPRGGYNFNSNFARMIESAGNGFYNAQSGDIDVASAKYTEKLKDFWNEWIRDYKVNYYKLDGWLLHPCQNKEHDHMVGGYDNVYEFTDYWERYIEVFKSMRKTADENNVNNLWISLTCYVNPSPFHLQWTNSIWVQISNDVGYTKITDKDTLADQMLNYRDNVYHEFYTHYQFQLPQQSVYNHDPIYGQTGTQLKNSLDDDEFRRYLLMVGMRGTSFFELYYTYSMIDEGDKWYVNSEVLNYIENRHSVLEHSQIFGGAPGSGQVYGYSAWFNDRGTIAIRNPSNEVKEYTINLNREIGVPENIPTTYRKVILDFNTVEELHEGQAQNYGDIIKVTLQPRETRIIDFEPTQDDKCAEIEIVKAINQKEIQIRFNKKIRFDINNYQGIQIEKGKLRGDLRTVSLYLSKSLENNTHYNITLHDVKDSIGNVLNTNVDYVYMAGNMIVTVPNQIGPIESNSLLSFQEYHLESFTIQLNIKDHKDVNNVVLIKDEENKISVEIKDNHVLFTVHSLSVQSKEDIAKYESLNVTCVRERNTMLKIYINGQLSTSTFTEGEDPIVTLKEIQICRSSIVYSSLLIASYGFSYKDALEINEDKIRLTTATASATSQQDGHEASKAIDDNEDTYWISKKGETEQQSISIEIDRIVNLHKVRYIPSSAEKNTAIKEYKFSVSSDGKDWKDFSGSWSNDKNDANECEINENVRFLKLSGKSASDCISVAQLYFFGTETENEDHNPTPPPVPTIPRSPTASQSPSESPSESPSKSNTIPVTATTSPPVTVTQTNSMSPSGEPSPDDDDEEKKSKAFVAVGIVIAVVVAIVIVVIVVIVFKRKKANDLNTQPLISYESLKQKDSKL